MTGTMPCTWQSMAFTFIKAKMKQNAMYTGLFVLRELISYMLATGTPPSPPDNQSVREYPDLLLG